MTKQTIERIKVTANESSSEFKLRRKEALWILLRRITFGLMGLMCWTGSMIIMFVIAIDPNKGMILFQEVNTKLYQLYAIRVSISIFIFLIDYVFKNKNNRVDEIIIKNPRNNK